MGVQGVLTTGKMWIIVKEKERSDLKQRLGFQAPVA
jgi:hypothetical protein